MFDCHGWPWIALDSVDGIEWSWLMLYGVALCWILFDGVGSRLAIRPFVAAGLANVVVFFMLQLLFTI